MEVVVVDNDAGGGARAVVDAFRQAGCPFQLIYAIQPERNIAKTRNMTVELATGEWLAFIDDDERAPPDWLRRLLDCAVTFGADVVLAPVEPQVPPSAAKWIRRGRFYNWPRAATGTAVPRENLRFGNLVLRGSAVRALPGPFDLNFALAAGEDVDMLIRLARQGAKIVWCDEAVVWEPVPASRLSLRWVLMRGYSGGQSYGRLRIDGSLSRVNLATRGVLLIQWTLQMMLAGLLAGLVLPAGRHRSVAWLVKAWANAGKLTALAGRKYSAYA